MASLLFSPTQALFSYSTSLTPRLSRAIRIQRRRLPRGVQSYHYSCNALPKPRSALPSTINPIPTSPNAIRPLSTSSTITATPYSSTILSSPDKSSQGSKSTSSRWLPETKARIGKCVTFGLEGKEQMSDVALVGDILAREWKGLVAGVEGFAVDGDVWMERVKWGDMDSMGHVNNVQYLRHAETSRVHYFRLLRKFVPPSHLQEWDSLLSPKGLGLILKSATVEFLFPLKFPDRISLLHSLSPMLSNQLLSSKSSSTNITSLTFRSAVLSHKHQRSAARISEDVVVYDYRAGKKAALPPWVEQVLKSKAADEEEARRRWIERRDRVDLLVQGLEEGTWLSGKEEDMGGRVP